MRRIDHLKRYLGKEASNYNVPSFPLIPEDEPAMVGLPLREGPTPNALKTTATIAGAPIGAWYAGKGYKGLKKYVFPSAKKIVEKYKLNNLIPPKKLTASAIAMAAAYMLMRLGERGRGAQNWYEAKITKPSNEHPSMRFLS